MITRRDFVKATLATGAAVALPVSIWASSSRPANFPKNYLQIRPTICFDTEWLGLERLPVLQTTLFHNQQWDVILRHIVNAKNKEWQEYGVVLSCEQVRTITSKSMFDCRAHAHAESVIIVQEEDRNEIDAVIVRPSATISVCDTWHEFKEIQFQNCLHWDNRVANLTVSLEIGSPVVDVLVPWSNKFDLIEMWLPPHHTEVTWKCFVHESFNWNALCLSGLLYSTPPDWMKPDVLENPNIVVDRLV